MEEIKAQEVPPLQAAAEELGADLLLMNSPIVPFLPKYTRALIEMRENRREKIVVLLVTSGGVADDAYRTVAALREFYDEVVICVSGWCKSAGTLLAIGADSLIFGCHGEMGPLDVQIAVKDEIVDNRDSGLILDAAIKGLNVNAFRVFEKFMTSIIEQSSGAITFRTAADLAADITIGLMAPIYEKIDPLRMGADQRAQNIGLHYAMRLNLEAENLRGEEALNMLLNGYPSHGFVIDLKEAQRLFINVKPLDGHLKQVVEDLGTAALIPESETRVEFLDGDDDGKAPDPASDQAPSEASAAADDCAEPVAAPDDVRGAVQADARPTRAARPRG